jgi:hypothetical protein
MEKWERMKGILRKCEAALVPSFPYLDHKELLSDRGFLVYVTRTYPAMVPYLKGFHLTIEMWRGSRDADGWREREADECLVDSFGSLAFGEVSDVAAPKLLLASAHMVYAPADGLTTPAPCFAEDIQALLKLADFEFLPLRVVRPSCVVQVYYGFGDASGKQFGATISDDHSSKSGLFQEGEYNHGFWFRIGLWLATEEKESSNYKELCNLVNTVSVKARAGRLGNCKFFIFTDNSTAEGCFYKETSKSKLLHSLVLLLRVLEVEYGMTLHVIHISGRRMIAQGTDGCLRGSLTEGVMAGEDMLTFVNLG